MADMVPRADGYSQPCPSSASPDTIGHADTRIAKIDPEVQIDITTRSLVFRQDFAIATSKEILSPELELAGTAVQRVFGIDVELKVED